MSNIAKQTADKRSTSESGLNVAAVGLKTMRQPIKPPKLASQRSFPTFSPKKILANVILKKGIVLFTTTHEAKSIIVRPRHQSAIPAASKAPRSPCIHTRLVLKACLPWNSMTGKSVAAAATKRRNTIWNGCKLAPRYFIRPSFVMPTTKCIKYQDIPTAYFSRGANSFSDAASLTGPAGRRPFLAREERLAMVVTAATKAAELVTATAPGFVVLLNSGDANSACEAPSGRAHARASFTESTSRTGRAVVKPVLPLERANAPAPAANTADPASLRLVDILP
mmetsp:Transcript_24570/g.56677  ORF Transcript_24570/g.56677 Transcript_24570/m.56677 type:complete len:281 (-) Transcript_24570:34-876(-)